MKQIKFLEVGMKNFGPYIEEMIIPLNQNNLTLITGPNGIGKTMIIDAIPFSLYGTTSKGKKGDDVVNNVVGQNCHTWLTFTSDDVPYRVDRYHKHSKYGNTVVLTQGKKELGKGQRDISPLIETLIVPQRLFMNTLFFGQNIKTFFTDLTDTEKKEIFRKILDLDKYTTYYDETVKRLKELEELKNQISNELSVKDTLIPTFKKQIELLHEEEKEFYRRKQMILETYERDLSELQKVIQNLTSLLTTPVDDLLLTVNQQIADSRSALLNIKQEEDNETSSLTNAKTSKIYELNQKSQTMKDEAKQEISKQFDELSKVFDDKILNLRKAVEELQQVSTETQVNYTRLSSKLESIEIQINELTRNVMSLSICPTCLQILNEQNKTNLKKKIEELNQEKQKLDESIKQSYSKKTGVLQQQLDKNNELKKVTEEKAVKFNEQQTTLTGKYREIDVKHQALLVELQSRSDQAQAEIRKKYMEKKTTLEKTSVSLFSVKQKYEAQIAEQKRIQVSIDENKSKLSSLLNTIKEKTEEVFDKNRIELVQEKINSIQTEIKELHKQQQLYYKQEEVLNFWKSGFSSLGIPSLLIDESIPFMNERISYYLDKISNGRYTVSFDTLKAIKTGEYRDKISVNVLDNITKANSRIQLSGGQTRLVDIGTILTLCDLQSTVQNVTFNLLLFDEIFDSLDDENIGFVSKVLKELSRQKSLFIISHVYIEQLEADNVIALR